MTLHISHTAVWFQIRPSLCNGNQTAGIQVNHKQQLFFIYIYLNCQKREKS